MAYPKLKKGETITNIKENGKEYKDWTCLNTFKVAYNIKKGTLAGIMRSNKGDYSVWTMEKADK